MFDVQMNEDQQTKQCQHCLRPIALAEMHEHTISCPCRFILCKFGCGKKFLQGSAAKHYAVCVRSGNGEETGEEANQDDSDQCSSTRDKDSDSDSDGIFARCHHCDEKFKTHELEEHEAR